MPATDGALLERWIARRDAEAFNELVSRYAGLVYGVCLRMVRNHADAEDLAQDCFVKLASARRAPRASLAGWLHAAASSSAIDLLRSVSRRRDRERRFAAAPEREPAPASSWDELREHVDGAIAELPAELRDVIVAHFLARRTHEETAASLGVSRQTVTRRIQKGIERLRALLKRRGVSASLAALSACLGSAGAEAAPASLLASLGRLALAGPPAAAASAAPAVVSALAGIGGFIVAKKLVISAAAAAILILAAGYSVFLALSRPERSPPPAATERVAASTAADGAAALGGAPERAPGADRTRSAAAAADAAAVGGEAEWPGLAGAVVDVDGRPVGGAMVAAATSEPNGLRKLAEAVSDGSGRFRLEAAEAEGAMVVWSYKRGVGLGAAEAAPDGIEVVLDPLCELGGRIYDQRTGEGIAGLSLRWSHQGAAGASPAAAPLLVAGRGLFPGLDGRSGAAATGADGRYRFVDLSPGRLLLEFDPDGSEYVVPGFRTDEPRPDLLLAPGQRRENVDFALERGGAIAGTVFGPDGLPLAGAHVEILSSYPAPSTRPRRSDADGSYRFIGLAPGATYVVSASSAGLAPAESGAIAVAAAERTDGVDLQLGHGHRVEGRFIDDLGRAVAGIQVSLWKWLAAERRRTACGETTTAADGSFAFENVGPGQYAVWPSSNDHLPGEDFVFTMPEDRELSGLEFVLRRKSPGFISGRVIDHEGQPVADFPVVASAGGKTVGGARSGADGSFRIDGLGDAPSYIVTAYSGEYWSERKLSVPLDTAGLSIVVLRRGRIAGRVIDLSTSKAIPHFEVRAVFIRIEPDGGENRFHLKWTPFDSEDGEFAIERAEPVDCEVQVRAEGYVESKSRRFSIPPGGAAEGLVIALDRGAALAGTVRDAETGEPLPGVLVRAHQHDAYFPWLLEEGKPSYAPRGVWKLAMSAPDGGFEFSGLAPGEKIHLIAWKAGYGPAVHAGVAVTEEGGALEISLGRAATLAIAARFRPRAGERFEFYAYRRGGEPWRSAFRASAEAERPGLVEIAGLPPGPYRLAVYAVRRAGEGAVGDLLGNARVEIAAGERRELALDIDELSARSASVSGLVIGAAGLDRVFLNLVADESDDEPYAYAPLAPDTGGRFRFGGLPAGKYSIVVSAGPGQTKPRPRVPVVLSAGEHREVELALE